jgi:hypothetical protein
VSDLTPTENALVAYAILDQANADLEGGRPTEFVALDIARAQVYATLATVPVKPTQNAIAAAVQGALDAAALPGYTDVAQYAAEAVEALL